MSQLSDSISLTIWEGRTKPFDLFELSNTSKVHEELLFRLIEPSLNLNLINTRRVLEVVVLSVAPDFRINVRVRTGQDKGLQDMLGDWGLQTLLKHRMIFASRLKQMMQKNKDLGLSNSAEISRSVVNGTDILEATRNSDTGNIIVSFSGDQRDTVSSVFSALKFADKAKIKDVNLKHSGSASLSTKPDFYFPPESQPSLPIFQRTEEVIGRLIRVDIDDWIWHLLIKDGRVPFRMPFRDFSVDQPYLVGSMIKATFETHGKPTSTLSDLKKRLWSISSYDQFNVVE